MNPSPNSDSSFDFPSLAEFPFDQALCLGVAGNVAGHMEQAGETVKGEHRHNGPKGLFPTYVPGLDPQHPEHGHLGVYPGGNQQLRILPKGDFQIEPEMGLVGRIIYDGEGRVVDLEPHGICAYEDLTLRDTKIPLFSHKKNWGPETKGFGPVLPLDSFHKGDLKGWRIACWHRKGKNWYEYAVDTKVEGYSYFYEELMVWLIDRLKVGVQDPAFENLHDLLELLPLDQRPKYFAIGCGATCYTEWGHYVYMRPGDAAAVIVYHGEILSASEILSHLAFGAPLARPSSVLVQELTDMDGHHRI
jgi:hypothetical protein